MVKRTKYEIQKEQREAVELVNRLIKSVKKTKPEYTLKQIRASVSKATEYNPKNFAEGKKFMIYVLKQRHGAKRKKYTKTGLYSRKRQLNNLKIFWSNRGTKK